MSQLGGVPTIPKQAADQFMNEVPDGPLPPEALDQIENFLRDVNLGPDAIRYSPGSVALLGTARRLMATVRSLQLGTGPGATIDFRGMSPASVEQIAQRIVELLHEKGLVTKA